MEKFQISFTKFGKSKPPVILFPGWTHPYHQNESKFLDLLKQKFTIYAVNLPGYMEVDSAKDSYTFKDIAKAIHHKLDPKVSQSAIWFGYSMGCKIITEYTNIYHSPKKCILAGCQPGSYPIPHWAKPLISNSQIARSLRKSDTFQKFVINKAFRTITQDNKAKFHSMTVTQQGAYDSLLALLSSEATIEPLLKIATFIYGEADPYLEDIKPYKPQHLLTLKKTTHDCIKGNEQKLLKILLSISK